MIGIIRWLSWTAGEQPIGIRATLGKVRRGHSSDYSNAQLSLINIKNWQFSQATLTDDRV